MIAWLDELLCLFLFFLLQLIRFSVIKRVYFPNKEQLPEEEFQNGKRELQEFCSAKLHSKIYPGRSYQGGVIGKVQSER